jgi:hypothetical protein
MAAFSIDKLPVSAISGLLRVEPATKSGHSDAPHRDRQSPTRKIDILLTLCDLDQHTLAHLMAPVAPIRAVRMAPGK